MWTLLRVQERSSAVALLCMIWTNFCIYAQKFKLQRNLNLMLVGIHLEQILLKYYIKTQFVPHRKHITSGYCSLRQTVAV
jgi:hypothetical protein